MKQKIKYKRPFIGSLVLFLVLGVAISLRAQTVQARKPNGEANGDRPESRIYFPSPGKDWETIDPAKVGWDSAKLKAALRYAGERNSSGVVVLYQGRIIAENYWTPKSSFRYRSTQHGVDVNQRNLEDVASVQKSVAAVLLGVAVQKQLVQLDDPVHLHLKHGWSRASHEQESAITLRHLITMTTGLNDRLEFKLQPGKEWRYNTNAYSRIVNVLEAASKLKRNELTKLWLTEPVGMVESAWVVRPFAKDDPKSNRHGFATSARELAKFGLLIQARGNWDGRQVLSEQNYFREMLRSSQEQNPSYGYLWWLNGQSHTIKAGRRKRGPINKFAPLDMVSGLGALGRKVYVIPSWNLVVTRLGDNPGQDFDAEFWKRLASAAPPTLKR
ncbi:MAG: serine hydrolase [Mariniblastus sp.]|nr:serine hydrolase [Mariniblastus sp.]